VDRSRAPLSRRFVAAALLVAAAAAGGAVYVRGDEAPAAAVLSGVRITYGVEDLVSGTRTTEVVELDRPLRSRRVTGDDGSATTESGVYDRSADGWRQIAAVPPGEVGSDLRPVAALAWAEQQGLARREGDGSAAGRRCTWWLTREPLDLAAVAPATATDSTRSCIGEDGLLLAETWRAGGQDLRRRTATEVVRARVEVLDGPVEPLLPELVTLGVQRLEQPPDDLVAVLPPAGLRLVAAARVTEVEPGTITPVRQWVRGVYADGSDLLVVDQVRGPLDLRGTEADLGPLGPGRVQATGGGLVLTVEVGPEQHVQVRTSLTYDVVRAWLVGLRRH
jgi:hypothetical protein